MQTPGVPEGKHKQEACQAETLSSQHQPPSLGELTQSEVTVPNSSLYIERLAVKRQRLETELTGSPSIKTAFLGSGC